MISRFLLWPSPAAFSIKELGNLKLDSIGTGDGYGTVYDLVPQTSIAETRRRKSSQKNPQPQSPGAVLSTDHTATLVRHHFFNIDPQTSAPTQVSTYQFSLLPTNLLRFAAGDLRVARCASASRRVRH